MSNTTKTVVITGGTGGIGFYSALGVAKTGAKVIIIGRNSLHGEQAKHQIIKEADNQNVEFLVGDLSSISSVDALAAQLSEQVDCIDVLINNGGGQFFSPADGISPKGWDAVIATNLTGTWNMTRAVHDAWMGKHGGSITNITMLTKRTFPGMAHSVSARAGVEAMSRTLAIEWASKKIQINCIAPGIVASSGLKRYPAGLNVIAQMQDFIPMKRPATCSEIAWMVAYLSSKAGAYITGQTLTIDGGKELWGDWWPIPNPKDMAPVELPSEPWETE